MRYFDSKGSAAVKVCIAIAILLVLVVILLNVLNKEDNNVITEEIVYEYFPLYTLEEKVGVVDKTGKIIIEPKYTNVFIPNPGKAVFACESEEGLKFFDEKSNELFTEYENVSVIEISEYSEEVERNILSYKKDNKYGLIDITGKKLTEAIYDEVKCLEAKPGKVIVKKDNKCGVVDSAGNVIIDTKYNVIKSDGYSTAEDGYSKAGYIVSERTDNGIIYGYISFDGDVLIAPKYEKITRVNKNSEDIYLIVMERGKKGVIKNKKQLIKNNYQSVSYAEIADIFVVEKVGKYGFFSIEGDEILKPIYPKYAVSKEYITVEENDRTVMYDFFGNIVKTNTYASVSEVEGTSYFIAKTHDGFYNIISKDVNVNDKYKYLSHAFGDYFVFTNEENKSGLLHVWKGIVIEPKYDVVLKVDGRNAIEARDENNTLYLYNSNIEEVFSLENAVVQNVDENYTVIYSDTEMKYIDKNGTIVENTKIYPNNKLYSVKKDGLWGFVDKTGNIIVPCKYDLVTELNKFGFAGVKQDGKWGVINEKGDEIVVPAYEIDSYYFPQFIGKYELYQSEVVVCIELEER